MKKILLLITLFLLTLSSGLLKAQTVTPASPLQLCPDNNFVDLDSIIIIENDTADFAVESGVTYSLLLPTGFKFEPFTGNVFLSDSFTSGTFTVFPDSLQITYSINAGSETGIDSIIISGLRVRTTIASIAAADIDRGGTSTHAGNAPGVNSHGSLSSGLTLSGITVSASPVTCNGDNDGELSVSITSGNAPYEYSIDFGMTYPYSVSPIASLAPGGYVATVRDALGCIANSSNVGIITNPPAISGSVSKVDITCNGLTNGQLTATASGGTGVITYSINGSGTFANGSTRTNLTQGVKSVVFTDANGCTSSATNVTINEPSAINIGAPTSSDPTTGGGIDGQIIFGTVSGGTGPYNYSINGGSTYQTGATFNNLGSGSYNLQVLDANNCVAVFGPLTLNDPGNISAGGISFNGRNDTTLCAGANFLVVIQSDSAEVGGGVFYQWQISNNGVSWTNIGGATAVSYSIPGPHNDQRFYRRRTTQGGDVVFSNSVRRLINNGNTISITIPDPAICVEDGIQTFSASPAPALPATGVFALVSGSGLTDNGNGSSSFNPSVSGPNNFTVEYTYTNEFGCISSNTANITVNQNTSVSFIDQTSFLTTDPAFTLTGGIPLGGTYGGPGVFGNQFFPGLTGAGSFSLTYTQVDGNGCSDTELLPVTVSGVGSGDITGEKPAYCSDESNDTITGIPASGGTAIGFVAIPGLLSPLGSNQAIINPNFAPGNYIIQFDYQLGASTLNVTTSIRINTAPTASINTNGSTIFCFDDPVRTLSGIPASGMFQDFIGPGISNDIGSAADFTPSSAGVSPSHIITYIYEDANGCNDTATTTLTVNPTPNPSISGLPTSYCSNDPLDTLFGIPAPNYTTTFGSFSGSGLSNDTLGTVNFSPGIATLGNQTFTYTYTNSFGCSNSVSATRNVALIPNAVLSGLDVDYCTNNEIDTLIGSTNPIVAGSGFFIGLGAANGAVNTLSFDSGTLDVGGLATGNTYQVGYVFTNANGCVDTAFGSTIVNSLPNVNVTVLDDSLCIDGATVNVFGSPPPIGFDQTLFLGVTSQTNNTATFNPGLFGVGQHEITFIFRQFHPGNTCVDTARQTITVNPLPTVGFVFADKFTGDTITDLRFCEYQDSILLKANQLGGTYSASSANLTNIGGGQAFFRPGQTTSSFPVGSKSINYQYTNSITGCTNDTSVIVQANKIPNNVTINSVPSSAFIIDPPGINKFCTEDPQAILRRNYLAIPGSNFGTGTFQIVPDPGPGPGGLLTITNDTAVFSSDLPSGTSYEIRYIFIDTVTSCIDTIRKIVEIEAEPFLGVNIYNSVLSTSPPNSYRIDNIGNDTIPICINGDSIFFRGIDDTLGTEVNFDESLFSNLTDNGSIDTSNSTYVFYPQRTNITGIHTLQFDYTSNTGCLDVFTFLVDVLDTPQLDIILDSTFLTIGGANPELCKSIDTLLIYPQSNMSGFGSISISSSTPGNISMPSDKFNETVGSQLNDTLFLIKPNEISSTVLNPLSYTISYIFKENISVPGCTNNVSQSLIVNPLPRLLNTSFNLPSIYCEYDTIDLITGNGGISNFDSGFFKGSGIVMIGNDSATFNPQSIIPAFTDQGTTDSVTYVVQNTFGCVDSLTKNVTIHPKPNIVFTIQDTVNSFTRFCKSDPSTFVIQERQPNGILNGQTSRFFNSLNLSGPFFTPLLLNAGPNTLYTRLTTNAGCVDIDSQEIFVYEDPIAGFFVENFCIVDSISFRDTSLNNTTVGNLPDSIVEWEWQLTPFDVSNDRNPKFDYDRPNYGQGNYVIELRVTNSVGCSDDTDNIYFFGEPPIANFSTNDICAGQDILFRNLSDNVDPTFVSPSDFKWTFSEFPFDESNPIFNYNDSANFVYNFSNPGAYSVRLDISASYGCADTITKRLDIRPVIDLSNDSIYTSNFDGDSIEWRPFSINQNISLNSWLQTVPAGNTINNVPANGDQNFWVTSANNGKYFLQEKSYLEGPCFDFSQVKRPMIRFDYFSDVPANTGAVLQYSLDRGNSWRNIGVENSGIEWYNERSIAGNPGNQILGQVGWSIPNSGWLEAKHELDTLRNRPPLNSNNPFVRLRFAFGSDNIPNTQNREGFAFGNIQISERDKLVLIEHFTNSSDQNANQGDIDHNNLLDTRRNRYDVLDIQYHTDFPNADPINLDNPLEQGARTLFYGVSSIPRTVFEGNQFNAATSTWVSSTNILDNGKQRRIAERILEDAKFDIDLNVTKTNNSLSGNVTFTAKQNLIQGREYTGYIAVIEKFVPRNVPQGGVVNQGVEFRNVFKKFLPQAAGTNIKLINNIGDSRTINFDWNYSNVYNPDSVYVVAFIQDNVTREIYQVATDDQSNIWVPNSLNNSVNSNAIDFNIYPNPNSGRAILQFGAFPEEFTQLSIYSQMGTLIVEEEILPGSKNILINLEDYAAGVYIIQVAHPKYGIKKSRMVITK